MADKYHQEDKSAKKHQHPTLVHSNLRCATDEDHGSREIEQTRTNRIEKSMAITTGSSLEEIEVVNIYNPVPVPNEIITNYNSLVQSKHKRNKLERAYQKLADSPLKAPVRNITSRSNQKPHIVMQDAFVRKRTEQFDRMQQLPDHQSR